MKTGKWILLGLLCLVLVLGLVLGPGLYRGTQMLAMAATVWNQEEFSLDIRVNEEGNLRLDWRNTHRGRVLILESSGVQVYFCDGAIYLENGKGYDFSDTVEQINQLIQSPWKLYPLVKTSREGSSWTAVLEQPDLTVTMEQGQSGIGMAWVEWDEMKVQILPQPDREVLAVPEAVVIPVPLPPELFLIAMPSRVTSPAAIYKVPFPVTVFFSRVTLPSFAVQRRV